MSPCVERQLVATGCRSRTRSTRNNWTPTRRRLVPVRRRNAHIACEPATDQLPFDASALMSPAILRLIGRSQSQSAADNQSSTSCRPIFLADLGQRSVWWAENVPPRIIGYVCGLRAIRTLTDVSHSSATCHLFTKPDVEIWISSQTERSESQARHGDLNLAGSLRNALERTNSILNKNHRRRFKSVPSHWC